MEADRSAETIWIAGLNAGLGWRSGLDGGGFVALASDVSGILVDGQVFQDQESVWGKASFPIGRDRIEPEVSLLFSFFGYYGAGPFATPEWSLGYRFFTEEEDVSVSLLYTGYLALLPESTDDRFREGLRAVFRTDPSIRWAFETELGLGWENWYEAGLYREEGSLTGENRQDWILDGRESTAVRFVCWACVSPCIQTGRGIWRGKSSTQRVIRPPTTSDSSI